MACAGHSRADKRGQRFEHETLGEYPLASFTPRQLECLEAIIFTAFDVVALMSDERDQ
jgi:hypothetical protein